MLNRIISLLQSALKKLPILDPNYSPFLNLSALENSWARQLLRWRIQGAIRLIEELGLSQAEPAKEIPYSSIYDTMAAGTLAEINIANMKKAMKKGGAKVFADIAFGKKFSMEGSHALEELEKYNLLLSKEVTRREAKEVHGLLKQFIREGGTIRGLTKKIQEIYKEGIHIPAVTENGSVVRKGYIIPNKEWTKTVAITETTRAYAAGQQAALEVCGAEEKEWQTSEDERVCEICGPLNGKTVKIGDDFKSDNGEKISLHPPAHAKCRCGLKASKKDIARWTKTPLEAA